VIDRFGPLVDDHPRTLRDRGRDADAGDVDGDLGRRLEALGYK
jgi:hypothetical protein